MGRSGVWPCYGPLFGACQLWAQTLTDVIRPKTALLLTGGTLEKEDEEGRSGFAGG
jgi:hypothetical protein